MTKIQNLKKKYGKNDEKVKNGEELYDLSKKIWGDCDVKTVSVVVSDVMVEKKEELQASVMDEVELDDGSLQFLLEVAGFRFDEDLVRRQVGLIGKTKIDDLVKKWKNLLVNESMLNLRRLELIREHEQLALNALLAYSQREFDSFNYA